MGIITDTIAAGSAQLSAANAVTRIKLMVIEATAKTLALSGITRCRCQALSGGPKRG